jgi:acyl-coenzyme A thioesterase PaaI-like protein
MSRSVQSWPPVEVERPQRHPDAPAPGTELGPHYEECFGCGPAVTAGLHLKSTAGKGVAVHAHFTVLPGHQGAPGLAHGGVLTAAFDEALGTINAILRTSAVTGKLETDFLRPVPVGATLYIDVQCDGVAGRKIYSSAVGRIDSHEGPLAVRARALFITVGVEHFEKYGNPEQIRALQQKSHLDINP